MKRPTIKPISKIRTHIFLSLDDYKIDLHRGSVRQKTVYLNLNSRRIQKATSRLNKIDYREY